MVNWTKNINQSVETYKKSSYEKYSSYERFRFVKDIIAKRIKGEEEFLDAGCAKGEFIWYLKDFFPRLRFTGFDISRELLSLAQKEQKLKDVRFVAADAQNFNLGRKFDVVCMSGVLSIFDDIQRPLNGIARHLKPKGWGYIFGNFNREDIDVLVRYKNHYAGSKKWESGLNLYSLKSIKKALRKFSGTIHVYPFKLSKDLVAEKDPVKSYTLNTLEKGRIVLNGANIVTDFYLVEFQKKT